MKIFPAIDIKDKKCVRLIKGNFDNKTEYEVSPVEQAAKYKEYGFKNLHIVDLDGALTGETLNLDIIEEIASKFDLKIEVGGGIRSIDNIQKYTDVGVEKVILGSAAIKDKNFLKEACKKFPNKIALGLDAKDGYLSVFGWGSQSYRHVRLPPGITEIPRAGIARQHPQRSAHHRDDFQTVFFPLRGTDV